jgi:hypothetical protein
LRSPPKNMPSNIRKRKREITISPYVIPLYANTCVVVAVVVVAVVVAVSITVSLSTVVHEEVEYWKLIP